MPAGDESRAITRPDAPRQSDLRTRIQSWLAEEGLEASDLEVQGSPPPTWALGVPFRPGGKLGEGNTTIIGLVGVEPPGRIHLVADFEVPHDFGLIAPNPLNPSPGPFLRVREVCLVHEVGFGYKAGPDSIIKSIRLDDVLYVDAPITKALLFDRLRRLYTTVMHFGQALAEAGYHSE